jgi:acyl-CoA synthetase (AMP-forming)/AMP-acid ligase II
MSLAVTAGEPVAESLSEALERAALDPEAGIRLLDRREHDTWIPWSEVLAGAERVAAGLAAFGIDVGDRVGLVYPTGRELIEAFFGASLAGAVPACLPPPPRFGSLQSYGARTNAMLEAGELRMVLAESRIRKRLGEILAPRPLGVLSLEDLSLGAAPPTVRPGTADELALIQFSSGTALAPKPAALSHGAVLGQARLLNSFWPALDGVRHVGCSWLPLYHDMGLIGCLLTTLERPGELVLMPPEVFAARPAIWLRAISRFGATISPATNFAYAYCLESVRDDELEGVDLSGWRVALNGAEPISADVMRGFVARFARFGFREQALTPVYGLAEAALAVTFSDVSKPFVSRRFGRSSLEPGRRVVEDPDGCELVSVGRPVPGFDLAIRDGDLSDLEDGTVGRIWTRGSTLMDGYLGRRDATREVLRDGWLDTGDLGFVDRGELYVCGRVKDVIIVRGRNHSPVEIEQAVGPVAGVSVGGAAAVGHFPEGGQGEKVFLFVERTRGAPADNGLAEACRLAVLAQTGLDVDHVEVLAPDSIPRTSSGKVRRAETLRRYLGGRLGSP